ncbi:TIGR03085 family protein [Nocardia jinanensis]|uniref:TIGR03085 family protein n=2 Tax=Nocardia jinanensis TaxID=382504 RepID=A0A917VMD2_9NOCA|nr:TIGR03085 family protein [Nocardia jinanensis]
MKGTGPDAPTLCGEWTVRDLAAHLVVRERRPDAAPGIMLRPLAGYLQKVQDKAAGREFGELLEKVRTGPPWWSPLRPVDAIANLSEMFVHHEDVRRASSGWEPRELSAEDQQRLWSTLRKMGKMAYRKSPVPVEISTPGGEAVRLVDGTGPAVSLIGEPSELLLHAFGRDQVRIEFSGEPDAVRQVLELDRSI